MSSMYQSGFAYLISAGEFEIMEHGKINVHHYEAHCDDSAHDVKILNSVDINLGRRSQQRNARNETEAIFVVRTQNVVNDH